MEKGLLLFLYDRYPGCFSLSYRESTGAAAVAVEQHLSETQAAAV